MSLQSGYNLAKLKVIYTSRLRDDLSKSVTKLRNTLDSAGALNGMSNPNVVFICFKRSIVTKTDA